MKTTNNLQISDLLPHRKPMLLLDRLLSITATSAVAEVDIHEDTAFAEEDRGVPAWIGLEYMGQTAAMIGGYQAVIAAQQQATAAPRLGYLIGTRRFRTHTDAFKLGTVLRISCDQVAVMGESLAQYRCRITGCSGAEPLAETVLTVVRKTVNDSSKL